MMPSEMFAPFLLNILKTRNLTQWHNSCSWLIRNSAPQNGAKSLALSYRNMKIGDKYYSAKSSLFWFCTLWLNISYLSVALLEGILSSDSWIYSQFPIIYFKQIFILKRDTSPQRHETYLPFRLFITCLCWRQRRILKTGITDWPSKKVWIESNFPGVRRRVA